MDAQQQKELEASTSEIKVVVITGSTGTGKTKLSIELAERFNGEVVNADAMQVNAHRPRIIYPPIEASFQVEVVSALQTIYAVC